MLDQLWFQLTIHGVQTTSHNKSTKDKRKWWLGGGFNPLRKICSSNWIIYPRDQNEKIFESNHHLVIYVMWKPHGFQLQLQKNPQKWRTLKKWMTSINLWVTTSSSVPALLHLPPFDPSPPSPFRSVHWAKWSLKMPSAPPWLRLFGFRAPPKEKAGRWTQVAWLLLYKKFFKSK